MADYADYRHFMTIMQGLWCLENKKCRNLNEKKKYNIVEIIPKIESKNSRNRGNIYIPNIQIHDYSLSWFGIGTSR